MDKFLFLIFLIFFIPFTVSANSVVPGPIIIICMADAGEGWWKWLLYTMVMCVGIEGAIYHYKQSFKSPYLISLYANLISLVIGAFIVTPITVGILSLSDGFYSHSYHIIISIIVLSLIATAGCCVSIIIEYFSIRLLLRKYETLYIKPFLYPIIYANIITNVIILIYMILKSSWK